MKAAAEAKVHILEEQTHGLEDEKNALNQELRRRDADLKNAEAQRKASTPLGLLPRFGFASIRFIFISVHLLSSFEKCFLFFWA